MYYCGNYLWALMDFNNAIALKPKFADGYYLRSIIKSLLGYTKGAKEDFQKYIELTKIKK